MPPITEPSRRPLTAVGTLLAAGLIAGLATGCPDKDDEDTGLPTVDTGSDAADVDSDGMTDPPDGSDTGDDPDSGTPDTGPPGIEVSAKSLSVMPPLPANCDSPGKRQRLPFYFQANEDSRAIKPGDIFQGREVIPNETVGASSLGTRRMRISKASQKTCTSTDQCTAPLKCGDSGVRGAERFCTRQTGVEFIPGSARFDYEPNHGEDSGQIVEILVENTGMWEGLLPNSVSTQYDENGNDDFSEKVARASDPELKHRRAIKEFATYLGTANDTANTKVGLWFFGGAARARVRPKINSQERTDHLTDDLLFPKELIDTLPNTAPRPSNVYQAILRVIERDLTLDKYRDHEKFIVLVTDGQNEVWDDASTLAKVRRKLQRNGIHLFVMHLDSEIDPSLLRDTPSYWAGSSQCQMNEGCQKRPPCTTDDQCGSHQVCRKATLYADDPPSEGGMVTETDAKYCMPDYSDGSLGPVDAYADLACQTNGNYIYTTDPQELIYYARKIPYLFNGQWSVETEMSAFDEKVGLPDGYYRLSGFFYGLLGPNLSSIMSATSSTGALQQPVDSRGILRKNVGSDDN